MDEYAPKYDPRWPRHRGYSVAEVVRAIAHVTGVETNQVIFVDNQRSPASVRSRELAIAVLRDLKQWSYPQLNEALFAVSGRNNGHAASHDGYRRWLKRPGQDRAKLVDDVMAVLYRLDSSHPNIWRRRFGMRPTFREPCGEGRDWRSGASGWRKPEEDQC